MEFILGFLIAAAIAITGVGAGTITAPLLILFLHVPIALSVGTALAFSALVKMVVVPIQMWRKQVVYRVVGLMLLGGLPGVILGSLLFRHAVRGGDQGILYAALGLIVVASSGWHLYRHFRRGAAGRPIRSHSRWVAALMLPIGAEVGFSSSGAGALGSLALLSLTPLQATQVVGTDLAFGLVLSLTGGALHALGGNYDGALLLKLVVGGIFGAAGGSLVAPRLPNRQLRLALAAWLMMIGVQFCYQAAQAEQHQISSIKARSHHALLIHHPVVLDCSAPPALRDSPAASFDPLSSGR
ncbi:MAG TPA: sulfite exporter TauE/SafE family protein [Acidobacteriaceae bacterium]|nr:sulfite exporter TauE/SafE family protein [Acidobacteriaceae bacterium]